MKSKQYKYSLEQVDWAAHFIAEYSLEFDDKRYRIYNKYEDGKYYLSSWKSVKKCSRDVKFHNYTYDEDFDLFELYIEKGNYKITVYGPEMELAVEQGDILRKVTTEAKKNEEMRNTMIAFVGDRGTGKTVKLLKDAADSSIFEENVIILTTSYTRLESIKDYAKKANIDVSRVNFLTYTEWNRLSLKTRSSSIVYVDELRYFLLETLGCKNIVVSQSTDSRELTVVNCQKSDWMR